LYLGKNQGQKIESSELAALSYLREKTDPDATFIVEPWMGEDQPFLYVSFLADRPTFLAGAGVLRDHGHDTFYREKAVKEIYSNQNPQIVKKLLRIIKLTISTFHRGLK